MTTQQSHLKWINVCWAWTLNLSLWLFKTVSYFVDSQHYANHWPSHSGSFQKLFTKRFLTFIFLAPCTLGFGVINIFISRVLAPPAPPGSCHCNIYCNESKQTHRQQYWEFLHCPQTLFPRGKWKLKTEKKFIHFIHQNCPTSENRTNTHMLTHTHMHTHPEVS